MPSPFLTLWLLCTLLTSHGKLYSVIRASPLHVRETSPVKGLTAFFPSYTCLIYHGRSEQLWGLILIGRLAHDLWPRIKFLFVRPDFCLGLPSDSPSRGTPLPLAMRFPLFGCARDFHPLECAHAGQTDSAKSKQASLCSRCFPIFTAGHAVGGAEETGECGTAGDT